MLRANMRQEMVTTDELASELRKQGFNDYARIQKAFLEADGSVSVITTDKGNRVQRSDVKNAAI